MYEGVIQHLIDELGRRPAVGPKGAQRIAFALLAGDPEDVRRLAHALIEMTERVRFCKTCGNVAEAEGCRICLDTRRDETVICVVEEPKDVAAVEKIREFRGRYHVLGGAISPIDGIGPDDLRGKELLTRVGRGRAAPPPPRWKAYGQAGDPAGQRAAGRWRPGVRGRGDAGPRLRGAPPA